MPLSKAGLPVLIFALLALPAAALADAAHGHAPAGAATLHGDAPAAHGAAHGSSPLAGDFGNVLWTLIAFGAAVAILGKFAWGPLLASLQQRESFIKGLIDKAEADRIAQQDVLADYERKLAGAGAEIKSMMDEAKKDAERLKADILEAARREADEIRERTKREITSARDTALQEVYRTSADLAVDIAGRILKRELRADDHRRLTEESLEALRTLSRRN